MKFLVRTGFQQDAPRLNVAFGYISCGGVGGGASNPMNPKNTMHMAVNGHVEAMRVLLGAGGDEDLTD